MSIECLNFCIKQKCETPTTKLVLFILSNYADEKHSCYPSEAKLAELVGVSDRQIRRCLQWLEKHDFIRIEPRAGTSNRYYVRVSRGKSNGVDITVQRGGHELPIQGGHGSPNILKKDTKANTKEELYSKEFEFFWKIYPRKIGKYGAAKVYKTASKKHTHKLIYKSVEIFAKNNKMTEERFIPHCTTWLNQKRFLDVAVEKKKNTLNHLAG